MIGHVDNSIILADTNKRIRNGFSAFEFEKKKRDFYFVVDQKTILM